MKFELNAAIFLMGSALAGSAIAQFNMSKPAPSTLPQVEKAIAIRASGCAPANVAIIYEASVLNGSELAKLTKNQVKAESADRFVFYKARGSRETHGFLGPIDPGVTSAQAQKVLNEMKVCLVSTKRAG